LLFWPLVALFVVVTAVVSMMNAEVIIKPSNPTMNKNKGSAKCS